MKNTDALELSEKLARRLVEYGLRFWRSTGSSPQRTPCQSLNCY